MSLSFQHIPFARLADLAEGRLSAAERETTLGHTSACSQCADRLTRLSQLFEVMRADTTEDAPAQAVERAMKVFRTRAVSTPPPRATALVRRILAALSFDSLQLSPAFGVRSARSATRQLLFSVGENDLDLRVTPSGEMWVVSGQMLGPCDAGSGGRVELQQDAVASEAAQAVMNDLCEFALPPVPAGSYTLWLRLDDMEVEVPGLELRG